MVKRSRNEGWRYHLVLAPNFKPLTERPLWMFFNLGTVAGAAIWRRLLRRTRVIAISGSVGKTTTKECLVAILSSRFSTMGTVGNDNGRYGLPRLLLGARPHHRFVVAEVGIREPGHMWRSALLVRPDVVIITSVARQHMEGFRDLETIAREKAKLLAPLSDKGLAVLNRDDPRVAGMAAGRGCQVCYFGTTPAADVWADEATSDWPAHLALTLHSAGESHRVQTRLVGTHWVASVVAAVAAAARCGVPLRESAEVLTRVAPFTARLEPVELPCGATMLRDEYNGTVDTYMAAIEVLRRAKAGRRVAVFGRVHDHPDGGLAGVRQVAAELAGAAELAVFVGPHSGGARDAAVATGMNRENIHCFPDAEGVARFLQGELRKGDLVLLKGTWDDHLSRIYFAQLGTVACWVTHCTLTGICDNCAHLKFRPAAS